jgi:toxin ParE1/3/4
MTVILAPRATRDLRAIAACLRRENPSAALATLSVIAASIDNLSQHPQMGRRLNTAGVRRLAIPRTPYVAFYRIAGDDILVFHVRDGRRKPFRQ